MNRRDLLRTLGAAALASAMPVRAASQSDLRGDIVLLRRALALHPGLHRYATPREVAARIDRLEPAFVAAPTMEVRYLLLSAFLATIRCGHTYCNFFNQKRAVADALFDRPTRLPFLFEWIGGRMIVTGDPAGLGLPPGSEVLRIGDAPAPAMLDQLTPYARTDGHNEAKRVALLGVGGGERIETFDVFHGLVFGTPKGGVYHLALRLPDGTERIVEVSAIGLKARQEQGTRPDYSGDRPVWTWAMRPDGIAVLTMPGWALYDSKWDWRGWLGDRLASLKGAKGLVLDIRDNEGGQDCGDAILARLIDRPLAGPPVERRLRFVRTPADLDPYLDTWDDSFRTLGLGATPIGGDFWRQGGAMADETIRPEGSRLTLPVAALIGPTNSSATFQFAARARDAGLVRLFGGPTGGNRRGINGGCFFFVRLPASGLEFDLPLIGYYPPGLPPDAGVQPHVAVARTAADVAQGCDPVMAAATEWIART